MRKRSEYQKPHSSLVKITAANEQLNKQECSFIYYNCRTIFQVMVHRNGTPTRGP